MGRKKIVTKNIKLPLKILNGHKTLNLFFEKEIATYTMLITTKMTTHTQT